MIQNKSKCEPHRFYHQAMAAVFEISIFYEDRRYAEQAAAAAFDELDKLDAALNRFIKTSDTSRINNLGPGQSAHIAQDSFDCLILCKKLYKDTQGAFDITFGTAKPKAQLKLCRTDFTVQQPDKPLKVDLGGIGKGYALDKMAALLRQWDIDSALINGGSSTLLALGTPKAKKPWSLKLTNPADRNRILARIHLTNRSVSCSSIQHRPHIIDPQTKKPIKDKIAAWACAPATATADALSTAFMVMTPQQVKQYCTSHPDIQAMILTEKTETKPRQSLRFGPWKQILI